MAACETLSVPGTDAGVRRAADAFEAFAAGRGVASNIRWRFLVALDEALSNIVRHGYGDRSPGDIEMTFSIGDDALTVAVSDGAPPFNPLLAEAADLTGTAKRTQAGGLGIALLRTLMDEVHYERRDDRNHLLLSRRLHA